jgi:WD40 repeat protein
LLRRAAVGAVLCLACLSLSCSRQQARTSPQGNASPQAQAAQPNSPAAQTPQQQQQSPAQARAVIVAAPEPEQGQPQQAGGQPPYQAPDRLFENGHTAAVTAVAFSPDRQRVATGGDDKTIRIWDLAAGNEQRVLTGHTGRVTALAFSPNGTRLASASGDGIRVWDSATGNLMYAFSLSSKWAQQVAFSPDGQLLAASAGADDEGGNSYIEVRNATTGAKIHSITLDWNNATPLAITPDGRLLSSGGAGEDGEYVSAKTWELHTGRELKTLPALFGSFSPDGRWGASLEYRQGTHVNLWDIAAGRRVRTIDMPGFQASRVAFTPDGSRILAAGQNGSEIKFFEVATSKQVQSLPIAAGAGVIAFSGDGKWLAVPSGSSVAIWDLVAGRELQTLAGQLAAQDLAFSPDGKLLITAGEALGVWDVASGKLIRTVPGAAQSLILSKDGRWLAANPKGNLEIWDTKTWMRATPSPPAGQYVWWLGFADTLAGFPEPVRPAPLEPVRSGFRTPVESAGLLKPVLAPAAGVRWWQVGAGPEARSVWGATFPAALSPDGKILATAALRVPSTSNYDRPNVSIWDVSTGRLLQTFAAHELAVSEVAFSPDGKWLATSGQDSRLDPANLGASLAGIKHSIKLWDTATWQLRTSLPFVGMNGGLGNFSPDGRMLAVTSQNSVTLYDVPDGRPIKTLSGAGGGAVRFSPDGQWLARGSGNGIALWNLARGR